MDNARDIIRFEVQYKYPKVYALSKAIQANGDRKVNKYESLLADEFCREIISYYFNATVGKGFWYSLHMAVAVVKSNKFNAQKENRIIDALQVINQCRSLAKAKAKYQGDDLAAFKRTLKDLSDLGIAQIYFLRWGIETAYDGLKNLLAMNNISSKTRLTVYQDFYAILAIFNLAAFASYAADSQITQRRADKHNKYEYKASRYTILAILKPDLPLLLYSRSAYLRRKLLRNILVALPARPVPARNNRSPDRSRSILKYKNHPPKKPLCPLSCCRWGIP